MFNVYHPSPDHRRITSPYGIRGGGFHNGVDFAVPMREPILSASSGRVIRATWQESYGYYIIIQHDGFCTLYAHLDEMLVDVGDKVDYRQKIGLCGSTGRSTGPHLHFEIREGDYFDDFWDRYDGTDIFVNSVDPMDHLAPKWLEDEFLRGHERKLFNSLDHGIYGNWSNGIQITILNRIIDRLQINLK